MNLPRWSKLSAWLPAGLAAGLAAAAIGLLASAPASAQQEGEEGVRVNCFKCDFGFCYEYQYKTVAPRVLITKFRTYTWFPRTDEIIVPNTNGQWTEMQRGRHTIAGYDYVEVNLSVGPRSSSYIATQNCKTGWPTVN